MPYSIANFQILLQQVCQQSVHGSTHTKGIGQQYGRFNGSQFLDLNESYTFSKSVDDMNRSRHLMVEQIPTMRKHRCNAGYHCAVSKACFKTGWITDAMR